MDFFVSDTFVYDFEEWHTRSLRRLHFQFFLVLRRQKTEISVFCKYLDKDQRLSFRAFVLFGEQNKNKKSCLITHNQKMPSPPSSNKRYVHVVLYRVFNLDKFSATLFGSEIWLDFETCFCLETLEIFSQKLCPKIYCQHLGWN